MTQIETALAYLGRDPVLYVNLLEVLRRDSAVLVEAGSDGLLLFDQGSGAWMMSAQGERAYRRLIPRVPPNCDQFVGHELWYKDRVAELFCLEGEQVCYSAAWPGRTPPELPAFGGEVRLLTPDWAPWVEEHYSHSFGGVAYVEKAIKRGMLGVFLDGTCAGFVGFHDEGSIGMLEVLPEYRHRGLGVVLQKAAVRLALERGKFAFGQVLEDNAPSLALQRKVGMVLSKTKMFWLF